MLLSEGLSYQLPNAVLQPGRCGLKLGVLTMGSRALNFGRTPGQDLLVTAAVLD